MGVARTVSGWERLWRWYRSETESPLGKSNDKSSMTVLKAKHIGTGSQMFEPTSMRLPCSSPGRWTLNPSAPPMTLKDAADGSLSLDQALDGQCLGSAFVHRHCGT